MPSSQAAGNERRNERMITHEPPKLKTTLKTPPKQATNPLQFVKVGPCSLYRTAQEQLQKVQEVKKIKQEIRDDPEDWQSNLDNWKSSRRKRQEHIIERVVEVKKLELEEHDRQRRRSKTFSEMMEERGNRGRKLSISLAMYHEEDANDLSDLGIGTSSGKSSISGDTHDSHDDAHSVLSDRDSEIEKNHSDMDNATNTRIMDDSTTSMPSATIVADTKTTSVAPEMATSTTTTTTTTTTTIVPTTAMQDEPFGNGFGSHDQEYDSAITATASSPEPEEYTYEGAIRGYVSRVSQNIPRRTLAGLDAKLEESKSNAEEENKSCNGPTVKIDIVKRREIFEKASQRNIGEGKSSNRLSGDFTGAKSIKERLSSLEKQKQQDNSEKLEKQQEKNGQSLNRLSGDMSSIRERLSHLEKEASERENRNSVRHKLASASLEVPPSNSTTDEKTDPSPAESRDDLSAISIKDRLSALDAARAKSNVDKRSSIGKHGFREREVDGSSPRSERSSSPDSEYYVSRGDFLRSLDSLDADASSGPDTFERVQSLEELDYGRRYPTSSSSAELLNDTDREDSGIHTADVSCSVSQADEPVDEDIVHANSVLERRENNREDKSFMRENREAPRTTRIDEPTETSSAVAGQNESFTGQRDAKVVAKKGTAESSSGERATNKPYPHIHPLVEATNISNVLHSSPATSRPIVYQSPKVPPRRTLPETTTKPKPTGPEAERQSTSKGPTAATNDSDPSSIAEESSIPNDRSKLDEENSPKIPPKTPPKPKLSTSKGILEFPLTNKEDEKDLTGLKMESSKPEAGTSAEETTDLVFGSAILRANNSTTTIGNADTSSSSSSLCSLQEVSKIASPLQNPSRLASRIPTPLPRKPVNGKSTTSVSSPTSPSSPPLPRNLSPKARTSVDKRTIGPTGSTHVASKLSEIPVFVGPANPRASLAGSCENFPVKSSDDVDSLIRVDSSLSSPTAGASSPSSPTLSKSLPGSLVLQIGVKQNSETSSSLPALSATDSTMEMISSSKGSVLRTSLPTSPRIFHGSSVPFPCSPRASTSASTALGSWKNFQGSSMPSSPGKSSPGSSIPTLTKHWQNPATSLPCLPTLAANPQQADRRRTVVEVCEKVVVPRGETLSTPPVTPFITVECVGDKRKDAEEQVVTEKAIGDEVTAICQATAPVQPEEYQMVENVQTETFPAMGTVAEDEARRQASESTGSNVNNIPATTGFERLPLSINYPPRDVTFGVGATSVAVNEATDTIKPLTTIPKQIPALILSPDEEIVADIAFPLGPPTSVEPPKEKPPPPPVDLSDEENQAVEPLKRLNSTRRIKKELRSRRSDFLGIEGINDDDLDRALSVAKPPDMAAILAEERRIEHMHRHSYDTDSNYEQDSSHERDSGVELGHVEDWTKQTVSPDMSQHSRQSSEPFGASVTSSEEDEITKKEREIIDVLEKEEQWRYTSDRDIDSDIGEKLAHKLRELEVEKMQLERERAQAAVRRRQEESFRKSEDNAHKQEETVCNKQEETARIEHVESKHGDQKREEDHRIQAQQLRIQNDVEANGRRNVEVRQSEGIRNLTMKNHTREQENKSYSNSELSGHDDEFVSGEVLRVERELLQLEQEELKRQRTNLAYREQKQMQLEENLQEQWQSLQDVANCSVTSAQRCKSQPVINYRSSMPNLQLQDGCRRRAPPPPIPPAKPLRLIEQRQRDLTVRNSRIPSADSIPQQVDDSSLRYSASATSLSCYVGHQMSRQTLQALSAVPRTRIVQGDQWVQRRRSEIPRGAQDFNYQHWLIQEAEQRRINEKNQRQQPRKNSQHMTGTSVPYATVSTKSDSKPLPDSIIQTLTQRVQNRAQEKPLQPRRRLEHSTSQEHLSSVTQQQSLQQPKIQRPAVANNQDSQEKILSVSGKKKCSHCGDELGRGAAMIIESLRLFYHMECFKCCVCHVRLGDGLMGTDVRVRNHKLHCHNCYSSDDGVKFSCV